MVCVNSARAASNLVNRQQPNIHPIRAITECQDDRSDVIFVLDSFTDERVTLSETFCQILGRIE